MSISSALELELSLISFAGSDSILKVAREGIKEREEGKRGAGGVDYSREAVILNVSVKGEDYYFEGDN